MTKKIAVIFLAWLLLIALPAMGQNPQNAPVAETRGSWGFMAFGYGTQPLGKIVVGNAVTGSQTITMQTGSVVFQDGREIVPYSVGEVLNIQDGNAESVTVTAVAGCIVRQPANANTCLITATFASLHGAGAQVWSGSGGLDEALFDAHTSGGGIVVVDSAWASLGGITSMITAAPVFPKVSIQDARTAASQFWNPTPNATFLAVPATLTAVTALPSATPVGAYTTGTYHLCISYVDVMGNEGPCSLDFSEAGLATGSFIFSAPAASTGAVGYVPYISLTGGTYALSYRVPLATYSNGIATSNGVCALTTVETVIAACAVANTNYSQSGATATVTAITVNTARLAAQLGAASTTADIVPNSAGHTVYVYAPGTRQGGAGLIGSYPPFTITTAAATTVPAVLGSITVPPNFMNAVGRTIRICGKASQATAGSTSTIENIQFVWDADGSNTTGAGVIIGNGIVSVVTLVTANADSYSFCGTLRTTVAGTGVTAGSIQATDGWLVVQSGAAGSQATGAGGDTSVGATGSLNLANEARIDVEYSHTTGTDANGLVLQNLTVEVLN